MLTFFIGVIVGGSVSIVAMSLVSSNRQSVVKNPKKSPQIIDPTLDMYN